MAWSDGFASCMQTRVPLAGLTWFKLGGPARFMLSPVDTEQLVAAQDWARQQGLPWRVLGGGANLLIADDGVDGVVVRLDAPAFCQRREQSADAQTARVRVGAGTDLMQLTRETAREGLSGLEGLAGIPGTLGGAITMNAGGRWGEIGSVVESARLLDRQGRIAEVPAADLGFGYRHSNVGERTVLEATLVMSRRPAGEVWARYEEIWRQKAAAQPFTEHSAGCIFKNPPGHSAGRLIDEAGFKGARSGPHVRVSERHANFIVAEDGARAADVLALIERIRSAVRERTGIELELEIDVWSS